jgi:hypothetical protein
MPRVTVITGCTIYGGALLALILIPSLAYRYDFLLRLCHLGGSPMGPVK